MEEKAVRSCLAPFECRQVVLSSILGAVADLMQRDRPRFHLSAVRAQDILLTLHDPEKCAKNYPQMDIGLQTWDCVLHLIVTDPCTKDGHEAHSICPCSTGQYDANV